jgi:flagellar motor protein MotB
MGAAQYAPDTFAKAQQLLTTAQNLQASHADRSQVITNAREASQTAEDARLITMKRQQDEQIAQAKAATDQEHQLRMQAEATAQAAQAQLQAVQQHEQTAQAQASADRQMLDQQRDALQQAKAQAAAMSQIPPPPPPQAGPGPGPAEGSVDQRRDLRMSLYRQLSASGLQTIDSPRGLVVTIPANDFGGHALEGSVAGQVSQVAAAIMNNPGLVVEVDDNGDGGNTDRAEAVRAALMGSGVPASVISVQAMGNSRPVASPATPAGREANRRVEIAISGPSIGNMPYWDRTYSIMPH